MSDMSLAEAVNETAKWGNLIRALAKVEESAKAIQGIEQNITERTALRDKLLSETEAAQGQLALELEAVEKARADARDLTDKARADAREIKAAAKEAAEKTVAAAQHSVEEAGVERARYIAERDAARAELASLAPELAEARSVIERANATKAALAAINS